MRRQKRDKLDRAHTKGYNAGISGRSKEVCPYSSGDAKTQWLGGWREAMHERSSGFSLK